jgi:CDP-diacylglycerol pyrophosphatase
MTTRRAFVWACSFTVFLAVLVALPLQGASDPEPGARDPDALWHIVSSCFENHRGGYCACPSFARSCCNDPRTPDADVVLASTPDFVAIRDMKACGCPASFFAALAMPRSQVTGIEDPRRPEGIWPFAWSLAHARIEDQDEIALVINPETARTQNQMHVHLSRLKPGERERLDALGDGRSADGLLLMTLRDLSGVFAAVAAALGTDEIGDRGVLVMHARDGDGFRALITERFSPEVFTVTSCH